MEHRSDNPHAGEDESLVIFRNSEGVEARGTLLRLTRRSAIFEVYDTNGIVQCSENLDPCQIATGDRLVYSGVATVQKLVDTGRILIVEVGLREGGHLPVPSTDKISAERPVNKDDATLSGT
jgi:hypothetical protein